MSDFNAEIAAAVDAGGRVEADPAPAQVVEQTRPQRTQPSQQQPAPTADPNGVKKIHDDVLSMLGDDLDPEPKKPEKDLLTLPEGHEKNKKEEVPDPKKPDTKPQKKSAAERDKENKSPYLDRFLKEDDKGNLTVDDEILIPAGRPREWFEAVKREGRIAREAATRMAVSSQQLAERFRQLYGDYKMLEQQSAPLTQLATQLEIPEERVSDFITFAKEYKTDPVNAIKNMLTRAQLAGIDLTKIGANAPIQPQFLQETVERAVAKMLAPLQPKEPEAGELPPEKAREFANFSKEFPEFIGDPADTSEEGEQRREHERNIAEAIAQHPNMPLREIGLRYKLWLLQNQEEGEPAKAKNDPPAQKTYARPKTQHVGTIPQTSDWSKMSYQQIAATIAKEMNQ